MSQSYFKRVITYDDKTSNFKVECPELGLSVLSDTEMGGLLEMRKEVEAAAKTKKEKKDFSFSLKGIALPLSI